MTKPLKEVIKIVASVVGKKKRVLEIGSLRTKNQDELADLRGMFEEDLYVGLDMRKGRGVDLVADAIKLPFSNNEFDLVLCLEVLEHAEKPWKVAEEIFRVVKRNGLVVVSSQQNFPIHSHPSDYFRYTPFGLKKLFSQLKSVLVFSISVPFFDQVKLNPEAVILIGSKGKNEELKKIRRVIKKNVEQISVHKPYRHRVVDLWNFWKRGVMEIKYRLEVKFF